MTERKRITRGGKIPVQVLLTPEEFEDLLACYESEREAREIELTAAGSRTRDLKYKEAHFIVDCIDFYLRSRGFRFRKTPRPFRRSRNKDDSRDF